MDNRTSPRQDALLAIMAERQDQKPQPTKADLSREMSVTPAALNKLFKRLVDRKRVRINKGGWKVVQQKGNSK